MQSRTPRLDWIGKVLADSQAAPERDAQAPLRLVAAGASEPGVKPEAAAAPQARSLKPFRRMARRDARERADGGDKRTPGREGTTRES